VGSPLPTITLYFIFAYLTMTFSNIMSNTATGTILIPLGIYLMPDHIKHITVIIGLATSTGMLLPVSTPPNAIAYSTGLIEQKELMKGGLLVGLIGPALVVLLTVLLL
jgi:sodium-dependent dicarboxylate transporter 2/3/5